MSLVVTKKKQKYMSLVVQVYVVIFLICIFLAGEGLGYRINQEVGTRSKNHITPTSKRKRISLFHINRSQHINC